MTEFDNSTTYPPGSIFTVDDIRREERAVIVAWLRDFAEWDDYGTVIAYAANAIERGDHLTPTSTQEG